MAESEITDAPTYQYELYLTIKGYDFVAPRDQQDWEMSGIAYGLEAYRAPVKGDILQIGRNEYKVKRVLLDVPQEVTVTVKASPKAVREDLERNGVARRNQELYDYTKGEAKDEWPKVTYPNRW